MFLRVVSPIKSTEDSPKVVPDFMLDTTSRVYLPNTESGVLCDWTFKSKDVALTDKKSFPLLGNTLNEDLRNVCFIHGFYESVDSLSVRTILNGYLERGDHNVILVDWSAIGGVLYLHSPASIHPMAERISEALGCMEHLGMIRSGDLHIIGHSLGAHLAAAVSRNLGSVKRLTGLDPAGPLFWWNIKKISSLSKKDAVFVDVIHSDADRFGLRRKCGHVDFFPNGGAGLQPGCKTSYNLKLYHPKRLCSHWRSWRYYYESLLNEDAFLAVAAESWEDFKKGNTKQDVIPMGFCTPEDSSGVYFLQTSDHYPFGRGKDGIKYSDEINK